MRERCRRGVQRAQGGRRGGQAVLLTDTPWKAPTENSGLARKGSVSVGWRADTRRVWQVLMTEILL